MSTIRPCMNCGHHEFLLLPRLSVDVGQAMMMNGSIAGYASVQGQWVADVVVCTRCNLTSFWTINAGTMQQRVKEARLVTAQGG